MRSFKLVHENQVAGAGHALQGLELYRKVMNSQAVFCAEQNRTFDCVAQFPLITGPLVMFEGFARFLRKSQYPPVILPGEKSQQALGQRADVLPALSKRRDHDLDDIKPVEKVYERVGDLETRKANVRIITATNIDLESAIRAGRFREDLFYRLDVVEIVIPPLRERREDIGPLAEGLLAFFARQNHRRILRFTEEACEALKNYQWPGNVRELRNAIERAVLLCTEDSLGIHHFSIKLKPLERVPGAGDLVTMDELERTHIRRVLASSRSIEEACRILGMDSVTLWRKRKKYGL